MNNLYEARVSLVDDIKNFTKSRPIGGDRFAARIETAIATKQFKLFVPWAAPASGRTELTCEDKSTLQWLGGEEGLGNRLATYGTAKYLMMFADTYARRNKFDMERANQYWDNVQQYMSEFSDTDFTTTSALTDERMDFFQARQSYAFEKLKPAQQRKILEAAKRYSGETDEATIYESAATYSMLRAAEAEYVSAELDALWVSLNWPERDIMCGDAPRVYVPEEVRAPWLKEE